MPHTIAFLGGTGPEGRGLATRFALAGHRVIVGSRNAERAEGVAAELSGTANAAAVAAADIVVVTVPYEGHRDILDALAGDLAGKIVVDTVVPMRFEHGPYPVDAPAGSATEEAAELLPGSRVVGAFHNLAAETLLDLDASVHSDVLVTGGDEQAKRTVCVLAEQIDGVRAVDAGPLRYSRFVEGLTVLLVGINIRYKVRTHPRIEGLPS